MRSNSDTAITHVMEPALPGTAVVVMVGGGRRSTRLYAYRLPEAPSVSPGKGDVIPSEPHPLRVLQRTDEAFTVQMPDGPLSAWGFQIEPGFDLSRAWLVNRPRLDWHWPSEAHPGQALRILGRHLVRADTYQTADPEKPVSMGGLLKGKTTLAARLASGGRWRRIPVAQSSGYEAWARLPANMTAGEYEFRAHNGLGGAAGWSDPLVIPVAAADAWPARVFKADTYIARAGGDVDKGLAAALGAIEKNGGGVLQLGPRPYDITRTLIMPRRSILRGTDRYRTLLRLPTWEGPKPPYVAVMGDGDFAVEDLTIRGVHAPVLIAAPCIDAGSFDAAIKAYDAFEDRRCRNVAIRRCHLEQNLLWRTDRRQAGEEVHEATWDLPEGQVHLREVQKYGDNEGRYGKGGGHAACVLLRGDDLDLEDNTVLGASHAVIINRSSHVRVAGNTLCPGAQGNAVHFLSGLIWPPNYPEGGGARIRGKFCTHLLVEDNDMSARSERARNLLNFLFGGERIHTARNNIHRLAPNSDAEALLTHLWQGHWDDATIRMIDPLTAEIVDPAGQLTHECLDGACIEIVGGRGAGQVRDIVQREASIVTLDRPWIVEPDETSRISFSAPPSFRQVTLVDNRIVSQNENVIIWGSTYDAVVDGNYVADGRGIGLWSIRLEAKQGVWGGAAFVQIINNVVDRGWVGPVTRKNLLSAPKGIDFIATLQASGTTAGYDCLGLVVRGNHATRDTGIGFRTTWRRQADWDGTKPDPDKEVWRMREAGVVIEQNLCTDSAVGVIVEQGARAIVRANRARNVAFPLARPKSPD